MGHDSSNPGGAQVFPQQWALGLKSFLATEPPMVVPTSCTQQGTIIPQQAVEACSIHSRCPMALPKVIFIFLLLIPPIFPSSLIFMSQLTANN